MKLWKQIIGAAGIVILGLLGARTLLVTRPVPEQQARAPFVPGVRVVAAAPQRFVPTLRARGEVRPAEVVRLSSEVSGVITWVAPDLVQGGFVQEGQELLRVDPKDRELAVIEAQAGVDQARSQLATERAQAKASLAAWDGDARSAPPLVRREPQLAAAEAALASAQATLARRQRDVERSISRAPFDAWVRRESVALGQWTAVGAELVVLAHAAKAEVRLPMAQSELEWLLQQPGDRIAAIDAPRVVFAADFAGALRRWEGRLDRIEPELDPVSRMAWLVAVLDDPYGRAAGVEGSSQRSAAPLPTGLFVNAALEGRTLEDVFVLPRDTEREHGQIFVAGADHRLELRDVDITRREGEWIVIRAGLVEGEQVIISPLAVPVDGMRIQILGQDPEITEGPAR